MPSNKHALSPSQKRRIARIHLFDSPYRGLKIRVGHAENLDSPSHLHGVKEPVCVVSLGLKEFRSAIGKEVAKKKWNFDSSFDIPYLGEPRLRFTVIDKHDDEIGFHDMNMTKPDWHKAFEGPIVLMGKAGPAGTLKVYCEPLESEIMSPVFIRTSDGTPLVGTGASQMRTVDSLTKGLTPADYSQTPEYLDEGIEVSMLGRKSGFGSVIVTIMQAENLNHSAVRGLVDTADPYVLGTVGRHALRTRTVKNGGANPIFNEAFYFPYDGARMLKLDVFDGSDVGTEKLLCRTDVDLEHYLKAGVQPCVIPLMGSDGKLGPAIRASIEFSALKEQRPRVMPADVNLAPVVAADGLIVKSVQLGLVSALFDREALKKDVKKAAKQDVYAQVSLGKVISKKSKTCKDCNCAPAFHEVFHFPYNGEQRLTVELFENEVLSKDKKIGVAHIPLSVGSAIEKTSMRHKVLDPKTERVVGELNTFLWMSSDQFGGEYIMPMGQNDIHTFGVVPAVAVVSPRSPTRSVKSGGDLAHLRAARSLKFRVISGEGITKGDGAKDDKKMDPYVYVELDKHQKRKTKVIENSGRDPAWHQTLQFPYDLQPELEITIYDDDTMMPDPKIAMRTIKLHEFVPVVGEEKILRLEMFDKKKKPRGILHCGVELSPIGYDGVEVVTHKVPNEMSSAMKSTLMALDPSLAKVRRVLLKVLCSDNVGTGDHSKDLKIDPYVFAELGEKCKRQGTTIKNGGKNCVYNECLQFPYTQEPKLDVYVYDNNNLSLDKKLASGEIALGPLAKTAVGRDVYHRVLMFDKHKKPCGCLHVILCLDIQGYDGRETYKFTIQELERDVAEAFEFAKREKYTHGVVKATTPVNGVLVDDRAADLKETMYLDSARSMSFSSASGDGVLPVNTVNYTSGMYDKSLAATPVSPGKALMYNPSVRISAPHSWKQVRVILVGATKLKSPDWIKLEHLDPYVKCEVGPDMLRSKTCKDAGETCHFSETFAFPYDSHEHMRLTVFDDDKMKDSAIGSHVLSLTQYVRGIDRAHVLNLPLRTEKGKEAGILRVVLELDSTPLPAPIILKTRTLTELERMTAVGPMASSAKVKSTASPRAVSVMPVFDPKLKLATASAHVGLYITCERASGLDNTMWMGKCDPYLLCTLGAKELKSNIFKDKGENPVFRTTFTFPYYNERFAQIVVKDKNTFKDGTIGTVIVDLNDFAKHAERAENLVIWDHKQRPSGTLHVVVKFGSVKPMEPTVVTLSN